jgi:hypothetical protein
MPIYYAVLRFEGTEEEVQKFIDDRFLGVEDGLYLLKVFDGQTGETIFQE